MAFTIFGWAEINNNFASLALPKGTPSSLITIVTLYILGSGPHEKPRRMRTVFSPHQLDRLERYFKNQQYVGSAQRIYIASQLGLSETQVKVWFQNRRIRWRKQALTGAKATSPAQES